MGIALVITHNIFVAPISRIKLKSVSSSSTVFWLCSGGKNQFCKLKYYTECAIGK